MSSRTMQKGLFLFLIALLLLTSAALSAQSDVELSETVSVVAGNLTLSANYPAGWVSDINLAAGAIYIATSDKALETSLNGETEFDQGEIAISIVSPAALTTIGVDTSGDPVDILTSTLEVLVPEVDAEVSPFNGFGVPGAVALVVSDTPKLDVLLVVFKLELGPVVAGIQPSDPETVGASQETQDIVEAIMRSITLTTEAAQVDIAETVDTNGQGETVSFEVELPNGTFEFSIVVPEGWVSEHDANVGAFYMATSDNGLALVTGAINSSGTFAAGEVAISIALPAIMELMELELDADPLDAVNTFVELAGGEALSAVQTAESAQGVPVRIVPVTGDGLPGGSAIVAGAAFDAGTILVVVTPMSAFDDSIVAILDSIQFGGQGAPVEVTKAPSAEPIRQWASDADGTSQYGTSSWSFEQATGEPDTDTCGDRSTAWAGAGSTTREILRVSFETPVIPTEVNIYQTYNPGAIVQIDVANSDNPDLVLPIKDSADAPGNTKCPGVFTVDLSHVDEPIDRVVIYLDQSLTGSWNEIDAVELVGVPAE